MSEYSEDLTSRFIKGLRSSHPGTAAQLVHTEETLFKVMKVLEGFSLGGQIGMDIVNEMLNQGLVFRELKLIERGTSDEVEVVGEDQA